MDAIHALKTFAFFKKQLKVFSLKQGVVGTTKRVHKHIRSGLMLIGRISSELLRIEKNYVALF